MPPPTAERSKSDALLIALSYVGFVSLGLPDAVAGVAWPSVRDAFDLPQSGLGLILAGSAGGYFASSFFSGRLVHALGVGVLLAGSTGLVAAGGFGFAVAPVWLAFAACSVLHGLGSGAIDAGLNGYAAAHLSARHMNWLHACYCLGAMFGPLLMTGVLAAGGSYRAGYAAIGGMLLLLAIFFAATRDRWGGPTPAGPDAGGAVGMTDTLRHPIVWLQMAVFFLYTGLEVTVGQWSFTLLTEARGVGPGAAGVWVSVYWGSIGVGRVLFGAVVERVGIDRLLRYSLLTAVAGAALFAIPAAGTGFAGLVLVGLGLAPVYPCLMTRTPQRLGPGLAAHAVGFQVGAAMIGAAAVPGAAGLAAGRFGLEAVAAAAVGLAGVIGGLHEVLLRLTRSGR